MSGFLSAAGRAVFQLAYQISPIVLTGGVASLVPGQNLPIVVLTEAAGFVNGLLQGSVPDSLDDYFAHFQPLPGATLIDYEIVKYPLANLVVAANAVIAQPLRFAMLMKCPAKAPGDYVAKLVTFTALQATLNQHALLGGLYTVATPAFIFTNCLLRSLRDVSDASDKQVQILWQWDFEQPLVTQQQAAAAQGAMMQRITNGLPQNGDPAWSGSAAATDPASGPGLGGNSLAGASVGGYAYDPTAVA